MPLENTIFDKKESFMSISSIIKKPGDFVRELNGFFSVLFANALTEKSGGISLCIDYPPAQLIYRSPLKAAEAAYDFSMKGKDVFYGVNPRLWSGDRKWQTKYCLSQHVNIKYGIVNRKRQIFQSREEAVNTIFGYPDYPSIFIDTGLELQCIWILKYPILLSGNGLIQANENNSNLRLNMKGDKHTSTVDALLRVPGTLIQRRPYRPDKMFISYDNDPYKNAAEYQEEQSLTS
jgi:hypothetical protein